MIILGRGRGSSSPLGEHFGVSQKDPQQIERRGRGDQGSARERRPDQWECPRVTICACVTTAASKPPYSRIRSKSSEGSLPALAPASTSTRCPVVSMPPRRGTCTLRPILRMLTGSSFSVGGTEASSRSASVTSNTWPKESSCLARPDVRPGMSGPCYGDVTGMDAASSIGLETISDSLEGVDRCAKSLPVDTRLSTGTWSPRPWRQAPRWLPRPGRPPGKTLCVVTVRLISDGPNLHRLLHACAWLRCRDRLAPRRLRLW